MATSIFDSHKEPARFLVTMFAPIYHYASVLEATSAAVWLRIFRLPFLQRLFPCLRLFSYPDLPLPENDILSSRDSIHRTLFGLARPPYDPQHDYLPPLSPSRRTRLSPPSFRPSPT
ncbi:hypothetical protein JCM10213_006048 [Rhodosporidiobolus nylandii]